MSDVPADLWSQGQDRPHRLAPAQHEHDHDDDQDDDQGTDADIHDFSVAQPRPATAGSSKSSRRGDGRHDGRSRATGVPLCQHCRMPPLFVLTVFKETGPQDFGGFELAEAQETAASDAVGVGEKWAIVKAPGQVGAGQILEEGQGPRR
jgi:hypothetical protein